jgi:hypothetical protein
MAEETMNIDDQLKALRLKKEALEYEDLEMRVENERSRRDYLKVSRAKQQETLAKAARDKEVSQSRCRHKKGGKNLQGIESGTDSDYSVMVHTYPWGETVVMCTRCHKEWRHPKKGEANYGQKLEAFKRALEFQTDNEPSGNRIFVIIDNTVQNQPATPALTEAEQAPKRRARKRANS